MTAADVLAMPSKFEGMPLAALEAMSLEPADCRLRCTRNP